MSNNNSSTNKYGSKKSANSTNFSLYALAFCIFTLFALACYVVFFYSDSLQGTDLFTSSSNLENDEIISEETTNMNSEVLSSKTSVEQDTSDQEYVPIVRKSEDGKIHIVEIISPFDNATYLLNVNKVTSASSNNKMKMGVEIVSASKINEADIGDISYQFKDGEFLFKTNDLSWEAKDVLDTLAASNSLALGFNQGVSFSNEGLSNIYSYLGAGMSQKVKFLNRYWYVVGMGGFGVSKNEDGITLLLADTTGTTKYGETLCDYSSSYLKAYLEKVINDFSSGATEIEKNAIVQKEIYGETVPVWILSKDEVDHLEFIASDTLNSVLLNASERGWWLLPSNDGRLYAIDYEGIVFEHSYNAPYAIRPLIEIRMSSISEVAKVKDGSNEYYDIIIGNSESAES